MSLIPKHIEVFIGKHFDIVEPLLTIMMYNISNNKIVVINVFWIYAKTSRQHNEYKHVLHDCYHINEIMLKSPLSTV